MIELRAFTETDVSLILDWITTEEDMLLWSGTTFRWPLDAAQLAAMATEPDRRSWTAIDPRTGAAVGHVSLLVDPRHRTGRLGRIVTAPSARGQGLGARLVDAALGVAFDELRLHRVGLGVYSHNTTALRLYERSGFVREGVLRDVTSVNGSWWSSVEMGMLEHERPQRTPPGIPPGIAPAAH
ncbi:GNAT family N-acetyltransferase [Actinomadura alba]|uniref:GNAT family N-acetyltransferase n=1 Tax=Actinomadura alba TaxID=406431 RepID=A0ABR7LU52_9ACTN|nr:GNAT family protein [Actinomadura alba]MBC6468300.1 GNAT family N-acetyltransferase [Actinomadura alba]